MSDPEPMIIRILKLIKAGDKTVAKLSKRIDEQDRQISDQAQLILQLSKHQEELLDMIALIAERLDAKDLLGVPPLVNKREKVN